MSRVLVTGANGQLGRCLRDAAPLFPKFRFVFFSKGGLDISDKKQLENSFGKAHFDYCINAAAYTNVEKAESDAENAFAVNAEGPKNLAQACKEHGTTLVHISTDYVFNGEKKSAYVETDATGPINVYGASKLAGEVFVQESNCNHFIIRTSWLYSQYGNNFYNSILKFAKTKDGLTITTEQTGAPTNANDLAVAVLEMINTGAPDYGLYHFSNKGEATWFDFAEQIIINTGQKDVVSVKKTPHYPT
ncbi:MAG: dTDP-4-dehydrorhamnose reductase, partial [Marinirhabdus sp.]